MPEPIIGLVLAAGISSRLGRPKQLEPIGGLPLVRLTVSTVLQSGLDEVLVVVGAEADRVRDALAGLPVVIVENPAFASGQASSLIAGVAAARERNADAVVVFLADQPGISPLAIDDLIAARRAQQAVLGMTEYGESRSHPVLFGQELFPELAALSGDTGGKEVVRRHQHQLHLVDGRQSTIPADLDQDADLDHLRRELDAGCDTQTG